MIRRILFVVLLAAACAATARAQAGRKVYISVDMEGISGISGDDQLSAAGREYDRSAKAA